MGTKALFGVSAAALVARCDHNVKVDNREVEQI